MKFYILIFLLLNFIVSGCASTQVIGKEPPAKTITVEKALESIKKGMAKFYEKEENGINKKTGLIVADAKVVFNLSADGTDEIKIDITDSITDVVSSGVSNITKSETDKSNINSKILSKRGNQITINLKHFLTLDSSKFDKEKMNQIIEFLKSNDIQYNIDNSSNQGL